jgi:hypothetical protein
MTDAGASAFVAVMSAIILEALGVSPYGIAMAAIGAVVFQAWSTKSAGKFKAMVQVVAGGLIGAVAAQGLADLAGVNSRAVIMLMSAFFGYGYQYFFEAFAKRADGIAENIVGRK